MALTAWVGREQTHSQSSITAEDRSMIMTTIETMSGSVQRHLRADFLALAGIPKRPKENDPSEGTPRPSRGLEWCRGGDGTAR
jgi:hypothetical protein